MSSSDVVGLFSGGGGEEGERERERDGLNLQQHAIFSTIIHINERLLINETSH